MAIKLLNSLEVADRTFDGTEMWVEGLTALKLDREVGLMYNRLQESHKTIAELVELLKEVYAIADPECYVENFHTIVENAIAKYGDINGD